MDTGVRENQQAKATARAVLLDSAGRVFLQKFKDPGSNRDTWLTPGGGIKPGEDAREALRRELAEETGETDFSIGPELLRRNYRFLWDGHYHSQSQIFFLAHCTGFEPCMADDEERRHFVEGRWWTLEDINFTTETVDPVELPGILQSLRRASCASDSDEEHRLDASVAATVREPFSFPGDSATPCAIETPVDLISLSSESSVSPDRQHVRMMIARELRRVPDSFFAFWQTLALEVGCRHACALCAQETGSVLTSFTEEGLEDLLAALLTVATERHRARGAARPGRLVGYGFDSYRPGIIKLSHDNDSGDSTLLAAAIRILHDNFGMKSRLSMVAYSRRDQELQAVHETIVSSLQDAVDSIRFSCSSHPLGWRKDREDYLLDFANMLRTWKPFVDARRGSGRYHGAITEFRMDPDVEVADEALVDSFVGRHHVIRFGPVLLISTGPREERPPVTVVTGVDGRSAKFRDPMVDYAAFISDGVVRSDDWLDFAEETIARGDWAPYGRGELRTWHGRHLRSRRGRLARLSNCDGPFYAFEPFFRSDGTYEAINIYPRTETRARSGVFNEVRWCLNALLSYKRSVGVGRRDRFLAATWEHVEALLAHIRQSIDEAAVYDKRAATHAAGRVFPLIDGYVSALRNAGYEPEFVFDPNFSYFAGPLYNLGRAITLFRGLVSRKEEPVTASEMREYFLTYQFAPPTKLSPIPLIQEGESLSNRVTGTKYRRGSGGAGAVVFEQLNRIGMQPINSMYIKGLVGVTRRVPRQ